MIYDFQQLKKDILKGREIEFSIGQIPWSLTNNTNGWQMTSNKKMIISEIKTSVDFVEVLGKRKIVAELTIREVFDNQLFDNNSLYIL